MSCGGEFMTGGCECRTLTHYPYFKYVDAHPKRWTGQTQAYLFGGLANTEVG